VSKIYLGTSGYHYLDWKNNFYPKDIKESEFLIYYSKYFNTVELNFTYYTFPKSFMFKNLITKIENVKDFVFSVKANSIFTHERKYLPSDVNNFLNSIQSLKDFNRLGSILFQFPYSFYCNKDNLEYIKILGKEFSGYEICAEFRNSSWLNNYALDILKSLNFSFCNVDEPHIKGLLKPTSLVIGNLGYIRFHGRNASNWWKAEKTFQRYDYMYSKKELEEWIPRLKEISAKAEKTYIYFNNHYKGKAPKSALIFLELLKFNNISSQI